MWQPPLTNFIIHSASVCLTLFVAARCLQWQERAPEQWSQSTHIITCLQAFAVATQTTQAHCTTPTHAEHQAPPAMPQLLSESAPSLPDMETIPPPDVPVRSQPRI